MTAVPQPVSPPLRVVVMGSSLTYVPGNYQRFLSRLLKPNSHFTVAGVFLHANKSLAHLGKATALILSGAAPQMGKILVQNWLMPDPKPPIATAAGIPFFCTKDPHCPEALQWLRNLDTDLLLHSRTRIYLQPQLLQIPRLGCINIHHGFLPAWRGTLCDLRQMQQGYGGGFSVHAMVESIDRGTLFKQTQVATREQCGMDYVNYIRQSENCEADSIIGLLEKIHTMGTLPPSCESISKDHPAKWYRTPRIAELRAWRKEGWRL